MGGAGGQGLRSGCRIVRVNLLLETSSMEIVSIREPKAHLTRHLRRVRSGSSLGISVRGRVIAVISPVETPADVTWAHRLVAEGRAPLRVGKPVCSHLYAWPD